MSRATLLCTLRAKPKEPVTPNDLDWREWDFRKEKLKVEELAACHAHEYGREIAKRCRYIQTQLKILWRANELPSKHQRPGHNLSGATLANPRRPKKIKLHRDRQSGYEAAFKLREFGIPVGTLGQRGFENRSWCSLPDEIKVAAVRSARSAVEWTEGSSRRGVLLRTVTELRAGADCTEGLLAPEIRFLKELVDLDLGGADCGFFAINWSNRLPLLKKQVCKWLTRKHKAHAKRKPRKPPRGQLRDQLQWLGALRCKEHYRRRHLTESNFQRIVVDSPYRHVNDLYPAAKKAEKILDDRMKEIERIGQLFGSR